MSSVDLATAGSAEDDNGGFRHMRKHRLQALERLAGLPALPLRIFALVDQEREIDETLIERITLIRPAVDAGLEIVPKSRPVGVGSNCRRAYLGFCSTPTRSLRPIAANAGANSVS
jgi:hypothetical protein